MWNVIIWDYYLIFFMRWLKFVFLNINEKTNETHTLFVLSGFQVGSVQVVCEAVTLNRLSEWLRYSVAQRRSALALALALPSLSLTFLLSCVRCQRSTLSPPTLLEGLQQSSEKKSILFFFSLHCYAAIFFLCLWWAAAFYFKQLWILPIFPIYNLTPACEFSLILTLQNVTVALPAWYPSHRRDSGPEAGVPPTQCPVPPSVGAPVVGTKCSRMWVTQEQICDPRMDLMQKQL